VLPLGQPSIAWFSLLALVAIVVLWNVGTWARNHHLRRAAAVRMTAASASTLPRGRVVALLGVLAVLVFSKYIYLSSLTSYYTFYLIETFDLSVGQSQLMLFVFLASVAAGTFVGGPIGDRSGRKAVIWVSILGVLPFTLALPYANLAGTIVLSVLIGVIIASAFSAILVYAQALVPGRVGMVSGLFFGFAFGMGGIGAAVLGVIADWKSIGFVYHLCSFLPLFGLLTVFLPAEKTLLRRSSPAGPRSRRG
jgi:FSR family fosmidomycin resistance protein-like MFS transporter